MFLSGYFKGIVKLTTSFFQEVSHLIFTWQRCVLPRKLSLTVYISRHPYFTSAVLILWPSFFFLFLIIIFSIFLLFSGFLIFVFLKWWSSHRHSNWCVAWATSNLNPSKHFSISRAVNTIFSFWQQNPMWYTFQSAMPKNELSQTKATLGVVSQGYTVPFVSLLNPKLSSTFLFYPRDSSESSIQQEGNACLGVQEVSLDLVCLDFMSLSSAAPCYPCWQWQVPLSSARNLLPTH